MPVSDSAFDGTRGEAVSVVRERGIDDVWRDCERGRGVLMLVGVGSGDCEIVSEEHSLVVGRAEVGGDG